MSTSKIILVQKAVKNISKNLLFRNRWVSINSLLTAVKRSYDFDDEYNINKASLSKFIGKMVTSIDNLDVRNVQKKDVQRKEDHESFHFLQARYFQRSSFSLEQYKEKIKKF